MRILLLAHSFNSLTQRLWVELGDLGHDVTVEFDVPDEAFLPHPPPTVPGRLARQGAQPQDAQ